MPSIGPPILLLDGGLGTTLQASPYNINYSDDTPLWSSHLLISSPETLLNVQRAFVENGADILLTATYQASFEGFHATRRESGMAEEKKEFQNRDGYSRDEAGRFMRSAVGIARDAFISEHAATAFVDKRVEYSGKKGLVALSLGAYGAAMRPSQEYTGAYSPPEMKTVEGLRKWHAERLSEFTEDLATWNDIDLVAFETLPLLEEIEAVRRAMAAVTRSGRNRKRWWITCVFPNDDLTLPDGSEVESVVEAMIGDNMTAEEKPWGIGINCTKVDKLQELIARFEDTVRRLLDDAQGIVKGKLKGKLKVSDAGTYSPWLVVYPDGRRDLSYNNTRKTWETTVGSGPNEVTKPWDQEVFEVVKETKYRRMWDGIVVGGCCNTTPDDINRLRKRIDQLD